MDVLRPALRGVSHRYMFFVAIAAGAALVAATGAAPATTIYATALAALFGISSTYHLHPGPLRVRARWERADHAMIFVFIAATYTPVALLGIGGAAGSRLLVGVWIGAGVGALQALFWPRTPRAITTALYLALGWAMVWCWPEVRAALPAPSEVLFLVGGGVYSVGAVVYALRRPDPVPTVFGYHEVFHALVIAGSACHFVSIWMLVTR